MNIIVILIIVLLLFGGLGTAPIWSHSAGWGYGPSGVIGLIVIILLVLVLTGRL